MRRVLSRALKRFYRHYRAIHVAIGLKLLGWLMIACSHLDELMEEDLRRFPDGFTIAFGVFGHRLRLGLKVREGKLYPDDQPHVDLLAQFKHMEHAFMTLTLREGSINAYARQRFILEGNVSSAWIFVRVLCRVQALILPKVLAKRVLKSVPKINGLRKLRVIFLCPIQIIKLQSSAHGVSR